MNTSSRADIISWVSELESEDPAVRIKARESLSKAGSDAVSLLATCLYDPRQHVRWEAAKTLESIGDASAAPALAAALNDDDEDVRWVAGKALIALKADALPSLLMGVVRHSDSVELCRAAHHVLHDLLQKHPSDELKRVIEALDSSEPAVTAPPAAWAALRALRD